MADGESRADFAAVDGGDARELVAMMDATDAWPAVRAARAWVLERADVHGSLVLDVGCGPGTFGSAVTAADACAIDIDRSVAMLREVRRRRYDARAALGDAAQLPLRDGAAHLVRAERVLQWTDDPHGALAELHRVTTPGGWIAITDTDWSTFTLRSGDAGPSDRWTAAALGWVPHARVAPGLATSLLELGASDVYTRTDTMMITAWDPDDPAQHDGPPGLPLRSITTGAAPADQGTLADDIAVLADRARHGEFAASVNLISVLARRSSAASTPSRRASARNRWA